MKESLEKMKKTYAELPDTSDVVAAVRPETLLVCKSKRGSSALISPLTYVLLVSRDSALR